MNQKVAKLAILFIEDSTLKSILKIISKIPDSQNEQSIKFKLGEGQKPLTDLEIDFLEREHCNVSFVEETGFYEIKWKDLLTIK